MSVHDLWRGARKGAGRRWEARWREGGRQVKRRFATRSEAEVFEARRRLDPETQTLNAGRSLTVDAMMATWLATKAGLPGLKTQDIYRTDAREVLLTFAGEYAATVTPSEVRIWVARDRGQSLRERSLRALRQAYKLAILDGYLRTDPTAGIARPRPGKPLLRLLTWDALDSLAGDDPLLWMLGTVGLRIGEAAGLKVGDVHGDRIHIHRQVTVTSAGLRTGPPKHGSAREVPVPKFVLDMLPLEGRGPEEWLFGNQSGGPMHPANWRRRTFAVEVARAGVGPLHPHDLRHTAASLAIAAGADVKSVQQMLGHASAKITLDLYAGLFSDQLDAVARRMDEAAAGRVRLRSIEGRTAGALSA